MRETEKKSQLDHALAQLIVHAPSNGEPDLGDEVSFDELAALSEGKLPLKRKQQVLAQLDQNQALYETWLALSDANQEEAVFDTAAPNLETPKSSLWETFSAWLEDLFSWQGAMTAAMGVFVGAIGMLISGVSLDESPTGESFQQITLNAPIESPQKAIQANIHKAAERNIFKCASNDQSESEQFCVSNTWNIQHWLYVEKGKPFQAIPSPFNVDQLVDFRLLNDKIILISSDAQSGTDLAVVEYQHKEDSMSYETLYRYINNETADKESASAIEIQSFDQNSVTFRVLLKEGKLVTQTLQF